MYIELSELFIYNYKKRGMIVNEEILKGIWNFP